MRRSDREITNIDEIIKVMEECDVCRLALNDSDYPYILPLNFGMQIEDGKIVLYFHGATEGTKYSLIEKDNRASFEMDCSHELVSDYSRGYCTMEYKSVIGRGKIEMVPDDEKYEALKLLVAHYHREEFPFSKAAIPRTKVFKLVVSQITGKVKLAQILKGECELLLNLDKLHTTELGVERIQKNLSLTVGNVVDWCRKRIQMPDASITRRGKNWYVGIENCEITINAYSYTIITAHQKKK